MASPKSLLSRFTKTRTRLVAVVMAVSIVLTAGTASAIIGEDIPILVEIAATELASYGELGAILAQAAALVEQVSQYTELAKVAWGAVEEIQQMTPDELGRSVGQGLDNAFPEVADIYGDLHNMGNLDHRDPRAVAAFRGILWEHAYGPGIDYLHAGHASLETAARTTEMRARMGIKLQGRRHEATRWMEICRTTSALGAEGACQAAAHRAAIQQAIAIADLQEATLAMVENQTLQQQQAQRRELDTLYAYERWSFDLQNYLSGDDWDLYEAYEDRMAERVSEARSRHRRDPRLDHRAR